MSAVKKFLSPLFSLPPTLRITDLDAIQVWIDGTDMEEVVVVSCGCLTFKLQNSQ